jgi:phage I-like protein
MEILTGNELISGAAVYLGNGDVWVEDLQSARLFAKEEAAERDAAIAATKATGRIISLEIEEVEQVNGTIVPKRLRERIRAAGPTAPLTLNGQAYDRQHLEDDGHVSI